MGTNNNITSVTEKDSYQETLTKTNLTACSCAHISGNTDTVDSAEVDLGF